MNTINGHISDNASLQEPFPDNADSIFITTPELNHRIELINHLLEYGDQLVVVTGKEGSGKTAFCNDIIANIEINWQATVIYASSKTNSTEIMLMMLGETPQEISETGLKEKFDAWLKRKIQNQETVVLLIDNAHRLDEPVLGFIKQYGKSRSDIYFNTCLFADLSILPKLNNDESHMSEMNIHYLDILPLTLKQTEDYVRSRIKHFGLKQIDLFDEATIKKIYKVSHGLPGKINRLCKQYMTDPVEQQEPVDKRESILKRLNNAVMVIPMPVIIVVFLICIAAILINQNSTRQTEPHKLALELPPEQTYIGQGQQITEPAFIQATEPRPPAIEELTRSVIEPVIYEHEVAEGIYTETETAGVYSVDEVVATEETVPQITESVQTLAESDTEAEPEPVVMFEPGPETTPAESSVSIPVIPDIRGRDWLNKQSTTQYVLQLIGAHEKETIATLINKTPSIKTNTASFITLNNGKAWYVLVYGLYSSRDEAVADINNLPANVRNKAPWPRKMDSVQQSIKLVE